MKKIQNSKLALRTETIRSLDSMSLANVAGGDSALCANTQQVGCVILTTACPTHAKGCQ